MNGVKYENTKICNLFHEFGGWARVVRSLDFRISVVFTILFTSLTLGLVNVQLMVDLLLPVFITSAPALIAVALAGLAIVVALSDAKFIKVLVEEGVFSNILLLYLIPAFSAALSIFASIVGLLVDTSTERIAAQTAILFISMLFYAYSLTGVISAVGTTLRYGIYRGEFIRRGLI